MRVGIVARGEDRGLGIQSWEAFRAIGASALLVDLGPLARGFQVHPDRFPGAVRVEASANLTLPETPVRDWLTTVDVVWAPETLYDPRLAHWAKEAGVPTVVHFNPEFLHPEVAAAGVVSRWWAPTPWLRDRWPAETVQVPVPVPDDRFSFLPAGRQRSDALTVVHVVGHRAAGDRNGTNLLLQALRIVERPVHVRFITQGAQLPRIRTPRHVTIERVLGGVDDYWKLYDHADVLVLPRRYGGLCLPAQEAMAAGLAVVMPDCSPNEYWWPTRRVPARARGELITPTGHVRMWDADPRGIARALDQLGDDHSMLLARQQDSAEWARAHRWSEQLDRWTAELGVLL